MKKFKQYLNESLENERGIEYEIGGRGGYIKVDSSTVFDLLGIPETYLDNVPGSIGAGCNYLGGGVRGAVFSINEEEYIQHGVPKTYARKLAKAGAILKALYIHLENGLNDETDEDGETNWNALATNASRNAGIISAY